MLKHIRSKMLIVIGSLAFVNIVATCAAGIYLGKKFVDTQTKEKIYVEQKAQTQHIEQIILSAQEAAESVAIMMEYTYQQVPTGQYTNIVRDNFKSTKNLFGMGFWFEPNSFDKDSKRVGKYIYRSNQHIFTTDIYESNDYNYLKQDYYAKVKESKKIQYLGPYYDEKLNKTFLTCSVPILKDRVEFKGCVTADIDFDTLEANVLNYNKSHNNRLYIVNTKGEYIIKPTNTSELSQSALKSKAYQDALKTILSKESGTVHFSSRGEKYTLYYQTMSTLEWKFIYELPDLELNKPVFEYQMIVFVIGSAMVFVLFASLLFFISREVINPLRILEQECAENVNSLDETKLLEQLSNRNDEFARIGEVVYSMKKSMRTYQIELENTIRELIASGEEIKRQNENFIINEKKLEEAIQYNIAIVKAIPDMIFLLSGEGKFIDVQGNDKSLYVPKEQFIGKYISNIMPKELTEQAMAKIRQCLETKQTQILEYALANEEQEGYFELRFAYFTKDEVVGIVRNITQEHLRTAEIEYLNYHDQLTGLYNRRYYEQVLKDETYIQSDEKGGIIFADLNGLKLVNDSFGHEAGDEFIINFAKILKASRFSNEIISRIGGDEFTVFVKNKDEAMIKQFIHEVEEECKRERVHGVVLSASFGYQIFEGNSEQIAELIRMAETQMYRTKMYDAKKRQQKTMDIIIQTLQENNPMEKNHAKKVRDIAIEMAKEINLNAKELELVEKVAKYHDIGKIGIAKEILNSSENYSKLEYEIVQKHPEIGYRILQSIVQLKDVSEYVLYHHERWDGKGYPKGLKGEKIPLISRIICLADAYAAMLSERNYKKTFTKEEAKEEIRENAGKQFDPNLADVLIRMIESEK